MESFEFSFRFIPLIVLSIVLVGLLFTKSKKLIFWGIVSNNILLLVCYILMFYYAYEIYLRNFNIYNAFDLRLLGKFLFGELYVHIIGLATYGILSSTILCFKGKFYSPT